MMPRPREKGRIPGLIVLLGLAAIALTGLQIAGYIGGKKSLQVLGAVPAFALIDQAGATFSSRALEGHAWIATFIYTTCPGPCPRVVERMKGVDAELLHDSRFRIVSFSVDPATDTPEKLAVYARERQLDPARWTLLTGPPDEIFTLARLGFKLGVNSADATDLPTTGPVVHSVHAVLVDGFGRIRGYYDTMSEEAMVKLVEDSRRLLREAPSS
jgi:protein SCO1/2